MSPSRRPTQSALNDDRFGPPVVWVAFSIVIVMALAVVQHIGIAQSSVKASDATAQRAFNESFAPPALDEFSLLCRSTLKYSGLDVFSTKSESEAEIESLREFARTAAERMRLAPVAAEMLDTDAALAELEQLQSEINSNAELARDLAWFIALYEEGPEALRESDTQAYLKRHGWFAELALAQMSGESTARFTTGGARLTEFSFWMFAFRIVLFLIGIVAMLYTLTQLRGLSASVSSVPVGTPFLLSFAAFAGMGVFFIGFDILALVMGSTASGGVFFILAQITSWAALLTVFLPRLMGVSDGIFRAAIGLDTGNGVLNETGIGFRGYVVDVGFAFVVGIALGIVMSFFRSDDAPAVVGELPIFEHPLPPTWGAIILSTIGAVVWAPIVEELVFRGVLFAWLRPRVGAVWTIVITAVAFGAIHPYGIQGIVQVTAGGIVYGVLREWRGSLIAPMVAHFLHNAIISFEQIGSVYLVMSPAG